MFPPPVGVWMEAHRKIRRQRIPVLSKILSRYFNYKLRTHYLCDVSVDVLNDTTYLNHNGFGIVISPYATIGKNVNIQHSVTIGIKYGILQAATIEDNVVIGARACIIGHDSTVGAGAVVIKDVPPYSVVVGNPARVVKNNQNGKTEKI